MADITWSAKWLNDLLLPAMRYRVETRGEAPSGAYEYYQDRLSAGSVISSYEIALAKAVAESGLEIENIHEIGCGWGQFVFLLAWCGYRAVGFEFDERRFQGADYFLRLLGQLDPERAALATIVEGPFPPVAWPEGKRDLVVATNLVNGDAAAAEESIICALHNYRYAIIDVDRFGRRRNAADRGELIARIEQNGLKNHGLLCDLLDEAQYYLFESPKTS